VLALRRGLSDLRYVEGESYLLEIRWTDAGPIRPRDLGGGLLAGSLTDDGGSQESVPLVEHALLDDLVRLE